MAGTKAMQDKTRANDKNNAKDDAIGGRLIIRTTSAVIRAKENFARKEAVEQLWILSSWGETF